MSNPFEQRMKSPNREATQSGDSFFSFIVVKHPLGYLLSLSFLSSHLTMRWQITPPATVTKRDMSISL